MGRGRVAQLWYLISTVLYLMTAPPSLPPRDFFCYMQVNMIEASSQQKIMSHVTDLQLEDLPGVEPHLISKLKRAGIQSILDLAVSIPHELALGATGYDGGAVAADTETISEAVF